MCIINFSVDYNPTLNVVQLMEFEVIMLYENTDLLPSGDSHDLYTGNYYPTEEIVLVLVRIPVGNQLGCVEVAKEE